MKHLHCVDSALKFQVRSGFEDLPDKIDVALIHEIATGTGVAPPNVLPGLEGGGIALSFSLMNTDQGSLADLIAPDQLRWADWTDGLNMLRRDGGHVTSSETESYVKALTEIGLKIKLLGMMFCGYEKKRVLTAILRFIRGEGTDSKCDCCWTTATKSGLLLQRAKLRSLIEPMVL